MNVIRHREISRIIRGLEYKLEFEINIEIAKRWTCIHTPHITIAYNGSLRLFRFALSLFLTNYAFSLKWGNKTFKKQTRTCETCFHYLHVPGVESMCLHLFRNHNPAENRSDCTDWYPQEKDDPYKEVIIPREIRNQESSGLSHR